MNNSFKNKVVIVTGSSMGIGKSVAAELLQSGAKVVINGRNPERLQQTYETLLCNNPDSITMFAADVSNSAECDQLIRHAVNQFGRIDVLINNAGISMEGELEELQADVFQRVMDVNVVGAAFATRSALPWLKRSGGSVLFVSSVAGVYGLPGFSPYSCSKMALTGLAESLHLELHGSGVHVGIAYLSFTQNDPDKKIFDVDGNLIPQPQRINMAAMPPDIVARRILKMIIQRRFKQTFSPMGKLIAFTARVCPSLFRLIIRLQYQKYRDQTSDNVNNLKHGIS